MKQKSHVIRPPGNFFQETGIANETGERKREPVEAAEYRAVRNVKAAMQKGYAGKSHISRFSRNPFPSVIFF